MNTMGRALILFLAAVTAVAEKLPLRLYTTADGLPHNIVVGIKRDLHGFLWFCTLRGLASFDGYAFKTYGEADGLPGIVTDVLETRAGEYWVSGRRGLFRFHPTRSSVQPMFEPYPLAPDKRAARMHGLYEDRRGAIWVATDGGLYRLSQANGRWDARLVDLKIPGKPANSVRVRQVLEDQEGALWIALAQPGVKRLRPDGNLDSYDIFDSVRVMLEDHSGRIWLGTNHGLSVLVRRPGSGLFEVARTYTVADGLRDNDVIALSELPGGHLWVGTSAGISELCPEANCAPKSFVTYASGSFGRFGALALASDRDGNLWVGNESGVLRLAHDAFTTYDEGDGLGSSRIYSIAEDRSGTLFVSTPNSYGVDLNEFAAGGFHKRSPQLPGARPILEHSGRGTVLQDRAGEWWVSTEQRLYRYSTVKRILDLDHARPDAVYTTHDGLPPGAIMSLFADSRGDVWISSVSSNSPTGALSRWSRTTGKFHIYSLADGLTTSEVPMAFCEHPSGAIWIGFNRDELARYRDGRFQVFTRANGLPPGSIWSLHVDRHDRLWIATTEGGAARIEDVQSEHPHFATFSTAQGLSSNQVESITEDQWGRIYLLTDRGVDRLDPRIGSVKHYTPADGVVPSGHWGTSFRDRQGDLWFGTMEGLSRLRPQPDESVSPPPIRISAIRIRGDPFPVSELGQIAFAPAVLRSNLNQIQIDFAGFNFAVGEVLRYQYKLEGADTDWSKPSYQRSVNYASLSPGKYRFLVRAINWKGMASAGPAAFEFEVLAPVWRRWWFIALAAIAGAALIYTLHHNRVERLLELERIRNRIASDLHDDIGASLSHIAVLSEVARVELTRGRREAEGSLMRIAEVSRELVDSMSEIVWAVNPHRDRVRDLVQRMREFAEDVLGARDITCEFRANESVQNVRLGMDARRQIFLIFKECVHNAGRHSGCSSVEIDLSCEHDWLVLQVGDDGRGLEAAARPQGAVHGHGLKNMEMRARALGGSVELTTAEKQGVTVVLRVPLKKSGRGERMYLLKYVGLVLPLPEPKMGSRSAEAQARETRSQARRSSV